MIKKLNLQDLRLNFIGLDQESFTISFDVNGFTSKISLRYEEQRKLREFIKEIIIEEYRAKIEFEEREQHENV